MGVGIVLPEVRVMTTGTGGTVDRTIVHSPTAHDRVLLSGLWIRRALRRDDVSVNWSGLKELNEGRAYIQREAVQSAGMVPLVRALSLLFEGKNLAGTAVEIDLRRDIGGRGMTEGSTSIREDRGISRITATAMARGRVKRTKRRIWEPSRMIWLPCSDSEGSERPRSVYLLLER